MKTIHSFMGMALCSFPVMAQQSPNFLIIQCDHLTQRVVGAYGADPSCTPPIDRIASQGVTFANAYVGCPLSQPSRAALWSGLMPHQTNSTFQLGRTHQSSAARQHSDPGKPLHRQRL